MNKQLFRKSLTSFAIASTMLFSAAAPAFATDSGTTSGPLHPQFTKVVQVQDKDTYQPKETFSFIVEGAAPTAGETAPTNPKTSSPITLSTGKGTIKTDTGTITAKVETDPSQKGDQTYTSSFDLSQLSFEQPGIYKYEVTETKGDNKDMDYDAKTYYLYVFVKRDENGNVAVYNSELVDPKDSTKKASGFTNGYGVGNKAFKDLTITKEVTGVMGDTQKDWKFDLTLTSGSGRSFYVVKQGNETKTLTSGKTYEFSLKSGQSIKVENLSTTDTYTVTEEEANKDGYTTTTKKQTEENGDITETITNKRDEVTPTGIMMMYGPYALMVALAGALGLFVAKKHRAEEE